LAEIEATTVNSTRSGTGELDADTDDDTASNGVSRR